MPNNVVKTPEQEKMWEEAKKQAEEQNQKDNYAYIMAIYKKMSGYESKKDEIKESTFFYSSDDLFNINSLDYDLLDEDLKSLTKSAKKGVTKTFEFVKKIPSIVSSIYKKSDEELVNNKTNIPKLVTRYGLIAVGAGATGPLAPLTALAGWYADKRIALKMSVEQKENLLHQYETELRIVEEKLKDEKDNKKKYALMKLESSLKRGAEKLQAPSRR
jgi:hypothetical protein